MSDLDTETLKEVKSIIAQLRAIEDVQNSSTLGFASAQITSRYNNLINKLQSLIPDDDLTVFSVQTNSIGSCSSDELLVVLKGIRAHIETTYIPRDEEIANIGNIIKCINDPQLKDRCLDLLSADGKFDRVIREATTILEDRIRTKAGLERKVFGVNLVGQTLNPDKGILAINGESSEKEGIYQMCRGVMLSFRDETHHAISDKFSYEDALKTVAFIDLLLDIIDKSKTKQE